MSDKYDRHIMQLREKGSNFAGPELTQRDPFPVLQAAGDVREVHAKLKLPARTNSFNPAWQFILAHGYDRQPLMVCTRKDWWPEREDWETDRPWEMLDAGSLTLNTYYWDELKRNCDTAVRIPNSVVTSDKSPWVRPEKPMPVFELLPALDSQPLESGKSAGMIRYVAARSVEEGEDRDGPCVLFVQAHPVGDIEKPTLGERFFRVNTTSEQLPGSMLNNSDIELAFRFAGRRGYKVLNLGHRG